MRTTVDRWVAPVPAPAAGGARKDRRAARGEKNWARAIARMRHGFDGHPYAPSEAEVRERRMGRIGSFVRG